MQTLRPAVVPLLFCLCAPVAPAAPPKPHTVVLGGARRVPYTPPEATPDTKADEAVTLRDAHDVTERTFVIRRALHINDGLPSEPPHWTWQPGPWLMVDRVTGHVTALHLPDFDPAISDVVWFRDYAAYCGIATTVKGGLVAVVAQLGARKAVAQKPLGPWPQPNAPHPVCAPATWQRTPMRATIQLTNGQPLVFDVVGTSSLVEEGDEPER
jgi:hypothetical protein